jgi:hypothetical protein
MTDSSLEGPAAPEILKGYSLVNFIREKMEGKNDI